MQPTFLCGHCRTVNRITTYSTRYTRETGNNAMQRCTHCGASHAVRWLEATVINPPLLPIDQDGRVSPWQMPEHRPLMRGYYECAFRDIADAMNLYWNGAFFQIDDTDARRVDTRTLYKWRGVWA